MIKNLKSFIYILLAVATTLFYSCSKEEATEVKVEFPELMEFTVIDGETQDFTFTVKESWRLTTSASWCKFVDGDDTKSSIMGDAGEQTITLAISDEVREDENPASVTLWLGAERKVIVEVTRDLQPIVYNFQIFEKVVNAETQEEEYIEFTEENPLEFTYSENGRVLYVNSELDFMAKDMNECFDMSKSLDFAGEAYKEGEDMQPFIFYIDVEHSTKALEGEFTIVDEDENVFAIFPFTYKGLSDDEIHFGTRYNISDVVTYSMDGESYIAKENADTDKGEFSIFIAANENKYVSVPVAIKKEGWMTSYQIATEDDLNWLTIKNNEGNYSIKPTNNDTGAEREMDFYFFTQATWGKIESGEMAALIDDYGYPNMDYDSYRAFGIKQLVEVDNIEILDSATNEILAVTRDTRSSEDLIEAYGTAAVFKLTLPADVNGKSYEVRLKSGDSILTADTPDYNPETWAGFSFQPDWSTWPSQFSVMSSIPADRKGELEIKFFNNTLDGNIAVLIVE